MFNNCAIRLNIKNLHGKDQQYKKRANVQSRSYIPIMYYIKVILLFIVFLLSLGYVVSKAGVEENKNIFSAELDIVRPWEQCKRLNKTHGLCGDDLFASSIELVNMHDIRYVMNVKIGTNKQVFRVSY